MRKVRKGKKLVIGLCAAILALDVIVSIVLFSVYAYMDRMDFAILKVISGIVRLGVDGVLLYFMYKGHNWAKWLLAVFFMMNGFRGLGSLLTSFDLFVGIPSLFYLSLGIILISSDCINEFFMYQQGLYNRETDEDLG